MPPPPSLTTPLLHPRSFLEMIKECKRGNTGGIRRYSNRVGETRAPAWYFRHSATMKQVGGWRGGGVGGQRVRHRQPAAFRAAEVLGVLGSELTPGGRRVCAGGHACYSHSQLSFSAQGAGPGVTGTCCPPRLRIPSIAAPLLAGRRQIPRAPTPARRSAHPLACVYVVATPKTTTPLRPAVRRDNRPDRRNPCTPARAAARRSYRSSRRCRLRGARGMACTWTTQPTSRPSWTTSSGSTRGRWTCWTSVGVEGGGGEGGMAGARTNTWARALHPEQVHAPP